MNNNNIILKESQMVDTISSSEIMLDEQQKKAVFSRDKNILVVAGAGSGKTRVLTERVKYLINFGVAPSNIVAITFTNLAADEMRDRLDAVPGINDAFIGTIHSFANKILRASNEEYFIYNDNIDNEFHKELIQKYCKYLKFDKFLLYKDMESQVEMGRISESVLETFFSSGEAYELTMIERSEKEIQNEIDNNGFTEFPESIKTLCKQRNIITFDELLKKAKNYFDSIGAHIEHVLVDEYQDVGTLENNFIMSLRANNYFFVGDDWQSLYGFKGGNVNIFLRLAEDKNFTVIYLTKNYRNSNKIIETATIVINQVKNKINKDIECISNTKGSVIFKPKKTLKTVLEFIKQKTNLNDYFILARTNRDVFLIKNLCDSIDLPNCTFKREGMTLEELNELMKSNTVKILTVHSSKGLEAKNVILYGNFPLTVPDYLLNEDERKVMYVGITRAKENLCIM